jgi:TonB family protein
MWAVKTETHSSLEDSLTLLCETLGKLKGANSVDIAEVIKQLKMAEESARMVRSLVSSELDNLLSEIQNSLKTKTLEQLRSRLLALATELERGSIVHRRVPRVTEVKILRDKAIKELRSRARVEGTPLTLPGPEADQWIKWACGLKEPADAESLRALQNTFAHLDDFVANLEPGMWIPAGALPFGIPSEPVRSINKTSQEQSRLKTKRFEEPVVSASIMSLTNLARHFNDPVEPPFTGEVPRVTGAPRAINFDFRSGDEEPSGGRWRILVASAVVLVLAALGTLQWRSQGNHASNGPAQSTDRNISNPTRSNPSDQGSNQSGISTDSEEPTASPKLVTEKQGKLNAHSIAPGPLSIPQPAKQDNKIADGALHPAVPPKNTATVKTEEPSPVTGGLLSEIQNSVMNILRDLGVAAPSTAAHNVWVSGGVAESLLVHQVKPRYPSQARQARIQGTVVVRAVIGRDGTVRNALALRGNPILMEAAEDAVRQWRYKPYHQNGVPVDAETRVNVNFTL